MPTFLALLLARTVSLIGSQLAGFALGVWLYQQTGSTTVYGLVALATVGPMVVIGPFTGVLIDRWDRRVALLVAYAGGAVCSSSLVLLHQFDALRLSTVMLPLVMASCFSALHLPAVTASATLLVKPAQLGRANGLLQLGFAVGQLAAPVTAGALLATGSLGAILLADVGSFLFALAVLVYVRIPRPDAQASRRDAAPWRDLAEAWSYLRSQPGLMALLAFFAAVNFNYGLVVVVFTPLVLGFADSRVLGAILSVAGVGMVAGSLVMTAWGGPRRRIHGVLGFALLQGLLLLLGAARPSAALVAAGAFGVMFTMPLIGGCSQTIWQRTVPPELQGRVFSLRMTVAGGAMPLAYAVAGPLVDRVFEPLMADSGPLAASVGPLLGTGDGRGVALLFVVLAGTTLLAVAMASLYPRLRRLDVEASPAACV